MNYFGLYSLACLLLLPRVLLEGIEEIVAKQHDYKLYFEWMEVGSYNKQYMKQFHAVAFKYNRTCTAANFTKEYNFDAGNDIELVGQAYKFASNEYRLFPIRMQVNLCYFLSTNMFGSQRSYACGNFTGCPIQKGKSYHVCNWVPDEAHFPPYIPNGRYRLDVQGFYKETELFLVKAYASIDRPIVRK